MENKPKNLWKKVDFNKHQLHVTISTIDSTTESEDADERIVYMEDLEKRKQAYGICGECNEPEGGFGKIYSAEWPGGYILYWDIKNQKWYRNHDDKYALKNLNNSSISSDFLNEIKSHLQIHLRDVVPCNGITQDPNTKDEDSKNSEDSEIYSQIKVSDEIGEKKFESRSSKDRSKNIQTHPQAIYTSRLLNFKNLPKPVNSSDLSSCQINSDANYAIQSILANPNLLYVICFS
ncbi:kinase-like domain-containing protein [Rhizophagus irregularis DAOM 181602=DAOM 197198]|nr:kinase-like domain-containing protein [Rhizophagus irregularis DAOM 181602=DAOM 197198]